MEGAAPKKVFNVCHKCGDYKGGYDEWGLTDTRGGLRGGRSGKFGGNISFQMRKHLNEPNDNETWLMRWVKNAESYGDWVK